MESMAKVITYSVTYWADVAIHWGEQLGVGLHSL